MLKITKGTLCNNCGPINSHRTTTEHEITKESMANLFHIPADILSDDMT